ncbi:membrane-spanning 4-domains subfamily A member 4D-like [Polypterus senegalus]|uniref:membrane-spanning 4-domains subfamily A member 4D-like n=1 Tax=Polypterus senegalus TaxID=55291 RepID=UPI0019631BBB|nr:membrane-spanning 4-domains subfamily A member 4D-like [Polypterus senegalus]
MAKTYKADDRMVIKIRYLKTPSEGSNLPATFNCEFEDSYKVFLKGNPKGLGIAHIIFGLVNLSLGICLYQPHAKMGIYPTVFSWPSVLFILTGGLGILSTCSPNICVVKSFYFTSTMSFLWASAGMVIYSILATGSPKVEVEHMISSVSILSAVLHALEIVVSIVSVHFAGRGVCRDDFNVLPVIFLEQNC